MVFFGVLFRQDGVPKIDTVWAEDGTVFAACAYMEPSPLSCLVAPYAGYLHAVPRIAAGVVAVLPPALLPTGLAVAAALVAGFTAFAVARAFASTTGSAWASLLAASALALTWQAGREVTGNLTNAHWILLTAGLIVLGTAWLGSEVRWDGFAVLLAAAASSAFAPLLAGFAIVAAVLRRSRWRGLVVVTLVPALVQLAIAASAPRPAVERAPVPPSAVVGPFLRDVIGRGAFGGLRVPLDVVIPAGVAVVCLLLGIAAVVRGADRRDGGGTERRAAGLVLLTIAALVVAGVVVFGASLIVNRGYNPRYGYVPAVLLINGLLLGAATLAEGGVSGNATLARVRLAGRATLAVAIAVLAVGFVRSFSIEARASAGPAWSVAYARAIPACASGQAIASVPISPRGQLQWLAQIPCSRVER